ncbi:uncharacterized protein EV420DRAFT_201092 [Desarmillaria tabescens]|uniref:Uncharacterized protein n=1 Tax=Armillaria tabescens TaxID=1929756 RepID=A0AA39J760_ARMTA|nr:uncharacterized protein EV420DRAFT_201092 [Desarmillaria tabescens]KAK0437303.1 hypothetical protein EV420DRAFT_201092 [Desarmillaria tabescens]
MTDYWVELNADKRTKKECEMKFCQVTATVLGRNSCFYQVNLCTRALLLDKEVGYVRPFTIILETRKGGKARALFIRSSHYPHYPPSSILNTLPKNVEAPLASTPSASECGVSRTAGASIIQASWPESSSATKTELCVTFGDAKWYRGV